MKNKMTLLGVGGVVIAAIVGFLLLNGPEEKQADQNMPDKPSIKQLVHDYSVGNLTAESASITPRELIVNGGRADEKVYTLPQEEFFVSVAPYIDQTHPCQIHSLTGCQGELTEQEFEVTITNLEGNTVVDQVMKSEANGFIDLWLPRDQTYRMTIEYEGKQAESEISTFDTDNTCVTTLSLS
ncbi:CueP family metal-binding protein [Paenibacillus sanguinis]|uniref:CueP family metal-binding protein n=1 Tax=Paenibacillus sanguinis TaxID=225906 RepID=UPI00037D12B0|nr:CueP family metal-binding protein [Paenibacillus sanguinis]